MPRNQLQKESESSPSFLPPATPACLLLGRNQCELGDTVQLLAAWPFARPRLRGGARTYICPTRTLTRLLALAYAEEILNKYLYLLLSITIHLLVISKGKPHPGRFLKKNKKPKPVTRTKETKEAHRTRHFRQTCFLFVPSPRAPP